MDFGTSVSDWIYQSEINHLNNGTIYVRNIYKWYRTSFVIRYYVIASHTQSVENQLIIHAFRF